MFVVKKYQDGWYRGIRCRDYQVESKNLLWFNFIFGSKFILFVSGYGNV